VSLTEFDAMNATELSEGMIPMRLMKIILLCLVFSGLASGSNGQMVTNQPARFKTKVISYEGKIGSGDSAATVSPSSELTLPGTETNSQVVTSPGRESELTWSFVGRNKDKDVYHFTFTRMTKAGDSSKTTSSRECSFDGRQIVVFTDDLHTVVMENPSAEELKKK